MLKKAPFDRLETGYMSPSGEFYPVGYMEHLFAADEIYEYIHGGPAPIDAEALLIKEGWLGVHKVTFIDHGYVFNFHRHLSPEQKRVVRPVFESERAKILSYAGGLELELDI